MLEQTQKLYEIFNKEQTEKINKIIETILKNGEKCWQNRKILLSCNQIQLLLTLKTQRL